MVCQSWNGWIVETRPSKPWSLSGIIGVASLSLVWEWEKLHKIEFEELEFVGLGDKP